MRIDIVCGAADPEMVAIRELAGALPGVLVYQAMALEVPVHAGNAYRADAVSPYLSEDGQPETVVFVECGGPVESLFVGSEIRRADHHRPGDPGWGLGPGRFLEASSIGQVISTLADGHQMPSKWGSLGPPDQPAPKRGEIAFRKAGSLARWAVFDGSWRTIPAEFVLAAASDDCPAAAYRNQCPGVTRGEIMAYRTRTRAGFLGVSLPRLAATIAAARDAIATAPRVEIGGVQVADLRPGTVAELPEAALQTGEVVMAQVTAPDGRKKIVIQGAGTGTQAGTAPIDAFLGGWAEAQGYIDLYGAAGRGLGGAYLP